MCRVSTSLHPGAEQATPLWLMLVFSALLIGCDSGRSASSTDLPQNDNDNAETPEPAPPQYRINLSGGDAGPLGSGGRGGSLYVEVSGHGQIELRSKETVDASYEAAELTTHSGHNDLVVDADLTIVAIDNEPSAKPEAGTPYLITDSSPYWLRRSNGDTSNFSNAEIVSGMHIYPSVTLHIQPNRSDLPEPWAHIELLASLINEGTITTDDSVAGLRTGLRLEIGGDFLGYPDSAIEVAAITPGQSGTGIIISTEGALLNHGKVDASGADRDSFGGNGGQIVLFSHLNLENHGTLISSAGHGGSKGVGGEGGRIRLETNGNLLNTGALVTQGGNGATGGKSHGIRFYTFNNNGDLHNSGDLDTRGGHGFSDRGGEGGDIRFEPGAGRVVHHASVTTRGGDNGGDSNTLYVWSGEFAIEANSSDGTPYGDILVSGDFDLSGGDATGETAPAGRGNDFIVSQYGAASSPSPSRILLAGYDVFDLTGGSGGSGGRGGQFVSSVEGVGHWQNDVPIQAWGGSGETEPGRGGDIEIQVIQDSSIFPDGTTHLINQAAINTSAGAATGAESTRAGGVLLEATGDISHSGTILAHGGLTIEGAAEGNNGRRIDIMSYQGNTTVSGYLSTRGGEGVQQGGHGTFSDTSSAVRLLAEKDLTFHGEIITDGGDATGAGGTGGYAGIIELTANGLLSYTGNLSARGGQGATAGEDAAIILNGESCLPLGQGC